MKATPWWTTIAPQAVALPDWDIADESTDAHPDLERGPYRLRFRDGVWRLALRGPSLAELRTNPALEVTCGRALGGPWVSHHSTRAKAIREVCGLADEVIDRDRATLACGVALDVEDEELVACEIVSMLEHNRDDAEVIRELRHFRVGQEVSFGGGGRLRVTLLGLSAAELADLLAAEPCRCAWPWPGGFGCDYCRPALDEDGAPIGGQP